MPELPEVETVRRGLIDVCLHATIESVTVSGARTVRRQGPAVFEQMLINRRIDDVVRRGKYLALLLDNQSAVVLHLRMSGRIYYVADRNILHELHTHAVVRLLGKGELRFVDPRTFGELFHTTSLDNDGLPSELASLGIDPLVDHLDEAMFAALISKRRTSLKAFFLDQHGIAGVGNLYADEICFQAGVRPDRRTDSLDPKSIGALCEAMHSVLAHATELRGSSLRDASYRDLFGDLGSYQDHHAVYGREGESCQRCGELVVRQKVAGRSAFLSCPSCQS